MALILVSFPMGIGYASWEARTCDVTVLSIEGAPGGIVFIADPHLRLENIDHIRSVIEDINRLEPSVVLIGGDFVYGEEEDFSFQEVWKGVDAPVYAILGNHDYKAGIDATSGLDKMIRVAGADIGGEKYDVGCLYDETTDHDFADALEKALEQNGVTVLRNEVVELEIDGKNVCLVGVDDGWAGMANPPKISPDEGTFVIYLIHEPECKGDWDADLILAGHTHGGQFNIAAMETLTSYGIIEMSGLVPNGDIPFYITRGIGTSNFEHELRFMASPEVVILNPGTDVPENSEILII